MAKPTKTTLVIGIGKPDDMDGEDQPKGLTIPVPDGFTPPDGVEDGETFQVMADVKMMDGHLVIEKLDGKDVSDAAPDADETEDDATPAKKPTLVSSFKDLMKAHQS